LAIVKYIVDAHAGTVTVTSTVGVGTTFTLAIPCLTDVDFSDDD
jgi:signal transduction histidine kinase